MRKRPEWLETGATSKRFGRNANEQKKEYRRFVEEGLAEDRLKDMAFGAILGTKSFVDWAREKVSDKPRDREIARLVKAQPRPSLQEVCRQVGVAYGVEVSGLRRKGGKGNEARDVALYLARERSGCSLKGIGEYFGGISGAGVCVAHKRVEQKLARNGSLRRTTASISAKLKLTEASR